MRGVDHDREADRSEDIVDGQCHLLGEPLLDLQPPSEEFCDPRKLGQAKHAAVGDVSDMDLEAGISRGALRFPINHEAIPAL